MARLLHLSNHPMGIFRALSVLTRIGVFPCRAALSTELYL